MLIPLKVDVPTTRRPWVNYALMAVIICTSIVGFGDQEFLCKMGGIEVTGNFFEGIQVELTTEDFPLPVLALTSSLLHGGWFHLIGNMIFLWIFGNAINYKFGHLGYIAIFAAAAMAGGLAHYTLTGGPAIGASGAIYGVMGAFLVFFPRNDITVLWIIWIHPGISRLSSGWIILFWIAWDVFYLVRGASTGVALWGHVGGFVAGLAIALVCASTGLIKPTQDEQTILQLLTGRR